MTHHSSLERAAHDRLFVGAYPCGIVYADRLRERAGDFARLAFLAYESLELQFEPGCPKELRSLIEADAAVIQARRGQPFQVSSCGQAVTLGGRREARERQRG